MDQTRNLSCDIIARQAALLARKPSLYNLCIRADPHSSQAEETDTAKWQIRRAADHSALILAAKNRSSNLVFPWQTGRDRPPSPGGGATRLTRSLNCQSNGNIKVASPMIRISRLFIIHDDD